MHYTINLAMSEEIRHRLKMAMREYNEGVRDGNADKMLNGADPLVNWLQNFLHNEEIISYSETRV